MHLVKTEDKNINSPHLNLLANQHNYAAKIDNKKKTILNICYKHYYRLKKKTNLVLVKY